MNRTALLLDAVSTRIGIAVAALPELTTWLPAQVLDLSIPKGPKFSE